MRHSMKPDLRADYKIRLYTGPKTPFFEVSILSIFHSPRISDRLPGFERLTRLEQTDVMSMSGHKLVSVRNAAGTGRSLSALHCRT